MARLHLPRIPEHEVTDESLWRQRRSLLAALAAAPVLAACRRGEPAAAAVGGEGASGAPSPFPQSADGFRSEEPLTRFADVSGYNNFYEFGSGKGDPAAAPNTLRTTPWSVAVHGACARPGNVPLETLLAGIDVEQRIYRLRCVEGWSMVIPWDGVPLAAVLRRFEPTAEAKFVAFTTLADPVQMPGVRRQTLDWPYREGLRIDEAMHPLAFLATGVYGQPLPQQNGAPLRLVLPWKYGFKSIKSIVAIEFAREMPYTSWNALQPQEYGFFANVNPDVGHPRWSQRSERRLAGDAARLLAERIPTRPFNGYGEQVASLYAGMDLRRWY